MPHAQTVPPPGFQALILCGPGVSLNTFTSSPEEFPKALVPIANRPMVWYPLDWCYRSGITNITVITSPSSVAALEAAFSQNPHLTSLPAPKPDIIAPEGLSQASSTDETVGTAQIFRLPEVKAAITGDFVVLPCDLVCELGGEALVEPWMIEEAGLGGATGGKQGSFGPKMSIGGEKGGRRGGLGVWYQTKGEHAVKGEETDFIATSPLSRPVVPPAQSSLRNHISNLVTSFPTDTLNDITAERKFFPVRHALVRRHARIKLLTSYRDAHLYFFPHWVLDMVNKNPKFDSLAEDVVGWWAKAGWQEGLSEKLGLREIFEGAEENEGEDGLMRSGILEEDVDLGSMSTTWTSKPESDDSTDDEPTQFASRVRDPSGSDSSSPVPPPKSKLQTPPMLAYVHPEKSDQLIRRVDTAPLLLSISLRLAKLESIEEVGKAAASPFAHNSKVAYPQGIAQRSTVTRADCLLGDNVTVEEKAVIKETVIGPNCQIGSGVRLTRCLLMDGAVIGERCQLTGCVVGRRSKIGRESILKDCEVQDNNVVPDETDAKNEKFMVFEGLEDDEDGGDFDMVDDSGDMDAEMAI
ncbi:eukaryotic translation initiation factor-like protein subunit eIF2B-gamma [Xylona heveae TC161]|uniref:Mannose-1-phosphate guanyltransferase n=1 Tax=Xylona heveae (strain CBS 132557 / TC161) TaxID=1328760 RepID=A0A165HWH5_XYLHT|nr:eukaryotic translation initiation factor-like protein subunit eIF2B-gamma [Xylona heveae TC161]KZF24023.1 eukaryotic translation initiation factor-like protein subunit eIF2B-gamma [Xylona heveae TC161]